jgi:hypothetical protein
MSSIDEKRVYSATEGKTDVFVATGAGVAQIECSGDLVGGFGLVRRCSARDIAADEERLAVATDEDILVWRQNQNQSQNDDEFESMGFGPASAVGYDDTVIAAGERGVARYENGDWNTFSDLTDVRAIDGDLLAAANGVYRFGGDGLISVGLEDARDVSTATVPLVATAHGLYQLANGWVNVLSGDISLVASDGTYAHAVADGVLYVRDSGGDENEWRQVEIPVEERIADIAYGASGMIYASTVDGTFLVGSDGWNTQPLGLPDVAGVAT